MPSAASQMPNLLKKVINHRYHLIRTIGAGSFGVVYEAIDLHAPKEIDHLALKVVSKKGRTASSLAALRKEIELHDRASSHPNVVTLFDAYEDDDYFFFVMEYCPGGDLASYIDNNGPYTNEAKLRSAYLSLVGAVEYLHSQGIYHRDLKPHNILVNEDGSQLFIVDFGLSSDNSTYERCCGTAAYMPPECINGDRPKARRGDRTDVWAVGLVLINMLCGYIPWAKAKRENEVYASFVDDPNFFIEALNITSEANKILRRTLRANPLIRASASEVLQMCEGLNAFLRTSPSPLVGLFAEIHIGCEVRSTIIAEMRVGEQEESVVEEDDITNAIMTTRTHSSGRSSDRSRTLVDRLNPSVVKGGWEKDIAGRVTSVISRLKKHIVS